MSTYTIELRKICEIYGRNEVENWFKDYDINDYLLPEQIEIINNSNIWNKDKLAKQIVDHFYMREIGLETPALFKHFAKVYMNEIMQEKLPLIYTMCLNYNPLINVDYKEEFSRTINGTVSSKGNSKSNSSNIASGFNINNNTPETNITKQDLESGFYASNTNQSETSSSITDNTDTTSSGNNNTEESYIKHFSGNQGISATYQAMIKQFRENIVAINKDIINELNKLFFGLY